MEPSIWENGWPAPDAPVVTSAQTHLLKIAKLEKLKIESSPAAPNLSKQGAWSARSHKIRPLEYHNSNTLNFSCISASITLLSHTPFSCVEALKREIRSSSQ